MSATTGAPGGQVVVEKEEVIGGRVLREHHPGESGGGEHEHEQGGRPGPAERPAPGAQAAQAQPQEGGDQHEVRVIREHAHLARQPADEGQLLEQGEAGGGQQLEGGRAQPAPVGVARQRARAPAGRLSRSARAAARPRAWAREEPGSGRCTTRPPRATSSGVPVATARPPASPPSGPRSMTWSAVLMTSRLCSMTTTVLPAPPPAGRARAAACGCPRSAGPWWARPGCRACGPSRACASSRESLTRCASPPERVGERLAEPRCSRGRRRPASRGCG